MFEKITPILLGVLLISLLCVGAACSANDNSSKMIEMMESVPMNSTSVDYWAMERLSDDEDLLEDLYLIFRESIEATQLKDIGVLLASVEHSTKVSGFNQGIVAVLDGSFNIKDIERSLEEKGYEKVLWQEISIWTPQESQGYKSVALLNGTILMGSVENLKPCIDTIINEEESLYDDSNIEVVTKKLPDGVLINIYRADSDNSEEEYEDLIAYGKSFYKDSSGETAKLKLTEIYMFQDNYAAMQALDEIDSYLGSKSFTDIKVKREKNFVRATALIYVSDFAQSLVY